MKKINWESSETELLLNPRLPESQKSLLQTVLEFSKDFPSHLWLCTSGSSELYPKLVALSKQAILLSAQAVNVHLQSTSKDRWLNPLPLFHVGGLGIMARSHLSHAQVSLFEEAWDPLRFHCAVQETTTTLTSLVPTQVYDLVKMQLHAPESLRAVIVGGGALSEVLYQQAMQLGWNLLPSYGLTECCSQVATAPLHRKEEENCLFPKLTVLSHVEVSVNEEERICLKSPSLLTTYAKVEKMEKRAKGKGLELQLFDPKRNGKYVTEDIGELDEDQRQLRVFGRAGDYLKIGGEGVYLFRLKAILEALKMKRGVARDLELIAVPDERLGHVIHLVVEKDREDTGKGFVEVQSLVNEYQTQVMPFEKVRKVHHVDCIPRSPLGKLLQKELSLS